MGPGGIFPLRVGGGSRRAVTPSVFDPCFILGSVWNAFDCRCGTKPYRSRRPGSAYGFRDREQIKARPALAGRARQPKSSGRSLAMEMMRPKAVATTKANPHERSAEIEAGSVTGRVIGRVADRRRINHDGRWLRIIINRRRQRHGSGG